MLVDSPVANLLMSLSPDAEIDDFLSTLALKLGLSAQDGRTLAKSQLFTSPKGLLCRIHVERDDEGVFAQPEVLLPLKPEDLAGDEVSRLLAVQRLLISQLGWLLSASVEGQLQLSSVQWHDSPEQVVNALDVANAVALDVLEVIVFGESQK